jgi:hypothetical protein
MSNEWMTVDVIGKDVDRGSHGSLQGSLKICMEGMRETVKNNGWGSWSAGQK